MKERPTCRPRRPFRYELYSLAVVLSVPLAIAISFPYAAVGFIPAAEALPGSAHCAFVSLTRDEEAEILAASRAAWKVGAAGVRRLRAEISPAEFLDDEASTIADIVDRSRCPAPGQLSCDTPPMPPSLAAPPAAEIPMDPESVSEAPAFSRQELLEVALPMDLSIPIERTKP